MNVPLLVQTTESPGFTRTVSGEKAKSTMLTETCAAEDKATAISSATNKALILDIPNLPLLPENHFAETTPVIPIAP